MNNQHARRGSGAKHGRFRRAMYAVTLAFGAYAALVARPNLVFAHQVSAGNIVLHAHEPLPETAHVIAREALARVQMSPLYAKDDTYDVFLCGSSAEYALFALWDYRSGGISQVYLGGNIYLRPANVANNRLIRRSGSEVPGDRTLSYYVAHELTHTMTARHVGRLAYHRLKAWQQEGYADYIGKGSGFDMETARQKFRTGHTDLDPRRSGLYDRYHLLVAELLDRQGLSVNALLAGPMAAGPLEHAILAGAR